MLKSLASLPEWHLACRRYRFDPSSFAIEALGMDITWHQDELFTSIAVGGSRTTVSSGHGCFGRDTLIKMHDGGYKFVQDIEEGDILMGEDNLSPRVVLYPLNGQQRLYKFSYTNGKHHIFNASHILCVMDEIGCTSTVTVERFLTWKRKKQRRYSLYKWKEYGYERIIIKSIKSKGKGEYFGFELENNHKFLGENDIILHNTGKTRSAGVIALWHLLFFPHSIMLFTAPQIDQLRKQVWKEIQICLDLLKEGRLSWLASYVEILAESVYIKGCAKTWHIFAKTAPPNRPTNLAGLHGDNLLIWCDEAAGVVDEVFDVLVNALTHDDNRMVLTSQPARPSGFFFDTHHRLSIRAGGVWNNLTFNSEDSHIVGLKMIKSALMQYGSREDPQYMIRVRGLFPNLRGEFLMTHLDSRKAWEGRALKKGKHDDYGYFMAVDVGGGVGRDDSSIVIAKVWGNKQFGDRARRIEVTHIPLCKNNDNIHELTAVINECMIQYPNITLLLDANGAGAGLGQHLKSIGIYYKPIFWGGQCFSTAMRKQYVNKRAQAYVCLSRALSSDRFKIRTLYLKGKIEEQLTRIPYTLDEQARFKILSKEEMARKGIKSPDLVDTFAFMFLEGAAYSPANDGINNDQDVPKNGDEPTSDAKSSLAEADEIADLYS